MRHLPPFNTVLNARVTIKGREDDRERTNREWDVGVESLLTRPETENRWTGEQVNRRTGPFRGHAKGLVTQPGVAATLVEGGPSFDAHSQR